MKKDKRHDYYICGIDCFIDDVTYHEHLETIVKIVQHVSKVLKDEDNFDSFDICDTKMGINIRLMLLDEHGVYKYTFVEEIEPDWSNAEAAAERLIRRFLAAHNPDRLEAIEELIEWGEKYGWE